MKINRQGRTGQNWQNHAQCQRSSVSLFFTTIEFEPFVQRRKREARAKTICNSCDVQGECLAYAMKHEMLEGVWGGLNEKERKQQRMLNAIEAAAS